MPNLKTVSIDDHLNERLERLAQERRSSVEEVLNEAAQDYVQRAEFERLLLEEAEEAWADYEATGLHVTAEEFNVWLARIAAGEDIDPPECHV